MDIRNMLQQALSSSSSTPRLSSFSPFPSASAITVPSPCLDPGADQELEDFCKKAFGLKLGKLRSRLLAQADVQKSALQCFCEDVRSTQDPKRRREIAKNFIKGIADITELEQGLCARTVVKMFATLFVNEQTENEKHIRDIARFENEVAELKGAMQRLELEKQGIEDEARGRFEEEKGVLEASLRVELQACQICLLNPRNVVIMPCLHGQFCGKCMEAHQKNNRTCPTCKGVIRGTLPYIA